MIAPTVKVWLDELLRDAEASPRPTPWERGFLGTIASNRIEWGTAFMLSEKQMAVLKRIEGKIHAAG